MHFIFVAQSATITSVRLAVVAALQWWAYELNAVGAVGLGLAGAAADSSGTVHVPVTDWGVGHGTLAWISAALFLAGFAGTLRRAQILERIKHRLATVETQATRAQSALQTIAELELDGLCKRLGYYSTERISIFLPVETGFKLRVRFSLNPTYRTTGRSLYPAGEGCLGRAWAAGSAYSVSLPDPRQSLGEWVNCLERDWQVPRSTAEHLQMKSRTYAAIRIDSDTRPRVPLGVVVIESELPRDATTAKLHKVDIERALKGHTGERLTVLLAQLALSEQM